AEAVDRVDVRLLHHLQELPRVGAQALDVPALALGVDRVEGKARFPGPRESGHADQRIPRQPDGDVFEVVLAGAVDDQLVCSSHEQASLAAVDRSNKCSCRTGQSPLVGASEPSTTRKPTPQKIAT